jgi:hypothetical protein
MIDTKILELMHQEIDGEIKNEDKTRLRAYMNKNPEAEKTYQTLLETVRNLEAVQEVEPPANLKEDILNQINPNLYINGKNRSDTTPIFQLIFSQKNMRRALALAAVFVLGFCISPLVLYPPIAEKQGKSQDISGTIGIPDYDMVSNVQSKMINLGQISGMIELKESENFLWIEVDLDSDKKIEAKINYNNTHIQVKSFLPYNPDEIVFQHTGNEILVTTSRSFILSFTRKTDMKSNLNISLHSSGVPDQRINFITKD